MKKTIIVLLTAVMAFTAIDATAQQRRGAGFGFAVEGLVGLMEQTTYDNTHRDTHTEMYYNALFTAGWHFDDHLFAGLATEVIPIVALPLHAVVRYEFTDWKVRPYAELRGGSYLRCIVSPKDIWAYTVMPSVGVSWGGFTVGFTCKFDRSNIARVEGYHDNVIISSNFYALKLGYYF